MRTVARTTATTNAVIRRCTNVRSDSALMGSLARTTDECRARLRIDGYETRVNGPARDRGRRRRGRPRNRRSRRGRGPQRGRRCALAAGDEIETMLERVVVAPDDHEHVTAEDVLRRRGLDEVRGSHRDRDGVSLAELARRI